jgi:aryl-alcohol dehydrogenase-like predicted oxidoreductase
LEPLVNAEGNFGVQKTPLSKKNIRISVENSLKNLQTEYLDLLQLHSFDPEVRPEETIEALESLVREGKIRYYGGSNYDPREWATMIDAFSKNPAHHFVSLQSHYNIIERKLEEAVIPQCKAAGISVLCYRGLARGILSGQYRRGAPLPQSSRGFSSQRISRHLTAEMFLLVETLENFASHFHRSPSELALSWLFSQPQVAVVILGMRHMEQVTSNCAAVDWKLTRQDLESLDAQLVKQGLMPRILSQPEVYLET